VTRTPTEIVAVPPSLGQRLDGLMTDTAFDLIHPVPPVPTFGIVM
jgi:hypothetical protein